MKHQIASFTVVALFATSSAFALDISNISNPDAWQQTTRQATLTVGDDGQTLNYRNRDTGMRLNAPATAGSKIVSIDESIPAQQRTSGASVTGNTNVAAGTTSAGNVPPVVPPMGNTNTGTGATAAGAASAGSAVTNAAAGNTTSATTSGTTPAQAGNTSPQNQGGPRINARNLATGALGAVGAVAGTAGVINAVSGNDEHSWGDVVQGVVSGATAAAGGAAVVNAIPVLGQIGYGAAVGAGALVGGLVAGSQLFSETDCLYDPITGQFTCCNTVFNKGERLANIGDYMFCGAPADAAAPTPVAPMVRQCLQGKMKDNTTWSDTEASWPQSMFRNDFWTPECTTRFCAGETEPVVGIESYIKYIPDTTNICYTWTCIDGYTRSGNTCVQSGTTVPVPPYTKPNNPTQNPYDELIRRISSERQRIIDTCGQSIGSVSGL